MLICATISPDCPLSASYLTCICTIPPGHSFGRPERGGEAEEEAERAGGEPQQRGPLLGRGGWEEALPGQGDPCQEQRLASPSEGPRDELLQGPRHAH